ncbi:hypothetical protein GDO78_013027 [Eleutherodactylus coqui]|uniref:Uncharacterized protein n=1 Tax=Eleutherodactylus coqui TaxID=57060 RepID=A0A8J6K1T6_ELECQ|nr:hypothetical protein GDO78_013027 [Eleutherodactylus coqui]
MILHELGIKCCATITGGVISRKRGPSGLLHLYHRGRFNPFMASGPCNTLHCKAWRLLFLTWMSPAIVNKTRKLKPVSVGW